MRCIIVSWCNPPSKQANKQRNNLNAMMPIVCNTGKGNKWRGRRPENGVEGGGKRKEGHAVSQVAKISIGRAWKLHIR